MNLDEIYELTAEFQKNDWRAVTISEKGKSKNQLYTSIANAIKDVYHEIPFDEAVFMVKSRIKTRQFCMNCKNPGVFRSSPSPRYNLFCSNRCRNVFNKNNSESILIDDVEYSDFKTASDALGISRYIIRQRIFDPNFPNYKWNCDDHDSKCIEKLRDAHPKLVDREFLASLNRSSRRILAEQLDVSPETIKPALLYFGLDTSYQQIDDAAIELKNDADALRNLYDRMTSAEIASLYSVSESSILKWLHFHGIEIKQERFQSAIERELIDFIQSMGFDVESRNRSAIGRELDIYVPEKKIAIECDGLFWHSSDPSTEERNRHVKKHELCEAVGITLLRFIDIGETSDKLDIVKSMIRSKLGMTRKIHARHCTVHEISNAEGIDFFRKNHISGNRGASFYIGLKHHDQLVMCISFSKPFMTKIAEWEIVRLASILDMTVVGGAAKIISFFRKNHPGKIMSYANLRHGNGRVYESIGLSLDHRTGPGYFYTDLNDVYSRHAFRKGSIEKICDIYDPRLTEFENAKVNGFRIYWDCGHSVFIG